MANGNDRARARGREDRNRNNVTQTQHSLKHGAREGGKRKERSHLELSWREMESTQPQLSRLGNFHERHSRPTKPNAHKRTYTAR